METHVFSPENSNKPARSWRGLLPILGALLCGALLLVTWFSTIAAQRPQTAPQVPADDFEIEKSDSREDFIIGSSDDNYYIIAVSMINTETTYSILKVKDHLPDGITINRFEDAIISGTSHWSCSQDNAKLINCNYNQEINPDSTFDPIKVFVDVAEDVSASVTNTAELILDNADPFSSDPINTKIDSVDLEINKTVNLPQVKEGDTITYTIVVTNYGPVTADDTIVSDLLSQFLDYKSDNPSTGTYTHATGKWAIGVLPKDTSETLTIVATTTTNSNGELIENTAVITSDNKSDWDPSNNKDTASFIVGGMEITKTVDTSDVINPNDIFVGEHIYFDIRVENVSDAYISNIIVTDTLDAGLDIIDCYHLNGYNRTPYCNKNTNEVNVTYSSLPNNNGNSDYWSTIRIEARGNQNIFLSQVITNVANLTWSYDKLRRQSNEVNVRITESSDLEVEKFVNKNTTARDEILNYNVKIRNVGSQDTEHVVITDTLDIFLKLISLDTSTLDASGVYTYEKVEYEEQWFRIELDDPLEPGEEQVFTFTAKVASNAPKDRQLTNYVEATTTSSEVYKENNHDDVKSEVEVPDATSMEIEYSVSPYQAQVEEELHFLIQIQNTGNLVATDIEVSDSFPAVIDFKSVDTDKGTVTTNTSARSFVWTIASLSPGKNASLSIVMEVNDSATTAETYTTKANMSWEPDWNMKSETIKFRVLPSSTLPPTGWRQTSSLPALNTILAVAAFALFAVFGLGFLIYYLWARRNKPLRAARLLQIGLACLLVATLAGFAAWGLQPSTQTEELVWALGTKPALPASITPSAAPTEDLKNPFKETSLDLTNFLPTPTPDTLPDYPIPTPTILITPDENGSLPDTSAVTRIVIPVMNLDTIVKFVPYNGSTWSIGGLKQEVAWMGDTSWPGLGGNTGLAGHVDLTDGSEGPFWNLYTLKSGDTVILYTEHNIYTYTVRQQLVVDDYDLSVIATTDDSQITLITCADWDNELRTYLKRLIVTSDLVDVKPH